MAGTTKLLFFRQMETTTLKGDSTLAMQEMSFTRVGQTAWDQAQPPTQILTAMLMGPLHKLVYL